ncbi:glycoside/pentoside/hexuronide:cation symporter, GPH family [Alteribacillus persepolensis]|uniref:Glycoside/pentoside/hexuronide:cation symporter, GPH family n=1 Tax=Alteribacillus persepolensis TaxID=568899 RepID=A0A1G8JUB9_9BACI|nr:MFS transporter [Alteribacillus persepolensis]SDI34735.1 glycoside/pentoside/hexuronide:cation symporter, GPH family [Alteribacillus persepolensis]
MEDKANVSAADVVQSEEKYVKTGPQPGFYKLERKEIFGYSMVDLAMNLVFQSVLMFITFYYTDVYGLPAAQVSLMFLLSRFWDAINDPMMGAVTERLNPKKGKYKPYILWGAIPYAVVAVLAFTVPEFGDAGKLIWAYLTYNLLNMLYTFIIQPYISLTTVMTADPQERTKLNSVRMTFAQSGGVIVALFIPYLTEFFGKDDIASGYQTTVILLSVITALILIYSYTTLKERIKSTSHLDPVKIKDVIIQLTTNRPSIILFLLFVGVYGFNTVGSASGIYYITYNADRSDLVGLFSLMNVLPSVLAVPFVPMLVKKIKKKNTVALGLIIAAIGSAAIYFIPVTAITLMMIAKGMASVGYGILMGILWSIIPDAVEYAEYNTGKRYPAVVYTTIGLGIKVALTVGGVIPTWILAMVGYVPNATQTAEALGGIVFIASILPAFICLVTLIIFMAFYNLTEDKVERIMRELAARHQTH